ncbi:hypothetical protein ACQCX2_09960 [Propionibacteriaceae bacterium Y1700]|uniref:hypothetical protein n=1 Tax=Microlunatus sp. Y1700 TaxID=3418487 RepID=UPI003DA782CC
MTSDAPEPTARLTESEAATLWYGRLSARAIIGPVLLIIVAVALTVQHLGSDPRVQECDGKQMHPGDSCIRFSTNTARTYEEMVARSEATWWVGPALYGLLALIAVALMVAAIVKWRTDRRISRSLPERPVQLGASSPVRVSLLGMIGAVLFLSVAVFSGSHLITDGWSWAVVIPIIFTGFGLLNLLVAWPTHGNLIKVHTDGSAVIATEGRSREVDFRDVRLFRPAKPGAVPELRLGEEKLLDLDSYIVNHEAIAAVFPRGDRS